MTTAVTQPPQLPQHSTTTRRPKILLLGDSLTQLSFEGWGATLANVYQRRCDVLNRGYSGYNTHFYIQHVLSDVLRDDVEDQSVALVIVWFGANDAALPDVDPHHHVPLNQYTQNLTSLVTQIRAVHPSAALLLMTPPPVHHQQRLHYQRQRYGNRATGVLERTFDVTATYASQCKAVANTLQVPLVDVFHLMQQQEAGGGGGGDDNDTENWASFLSDGLHFAPPGHAFVARKLLEAIAWHFPSLAVTPDPITGQHCNSGSQCPNLVPHGPYHDEIDPNTVVDVNTLPCERNDPSIAPTNETPETKGTT